jgi:hypothetical protein
MHDAKAAAQDEKAARAQLLMPQEKGGLGAWDRPMVCSKCL